MQKKFRYKIIALSLFNGFIPNLIGASLQIIFFLNFNDFFYLQKINPKFSIILSLLVFLSLIFVSSMRNRRSFKLLKKYENNELNEKEVNKLKQKMLNLPFFTILLTFIGWLAAGLIISTNFLISTSDWVSFVKVFIMIFFIGGSFAFVTSFFATDSFIHYILPKLFPDGSFKNINKIHKIRIKYRLMISFWIGGVLPILVLLYFTFIYFGMVKNGLSNSIIDQKFWILAMSLTTISVVMFLISSFYHSGTIAKPLDNLEKAMQVVENGNFNYKVTVNSVDELGSVCSGFNNMTQGLQERERIKDIFGKFVSSGIRDEILSGNLELGGKRTEASILFSDIRNFTSFSEKYSAIEVIDFLNSYFNEMVQPILRNKGVLDKFIGDAIMAIFGIPEKNMNHAEHAVRSALTMTEKLNEFNSLRKMTNLEEIQIGIGINSGEVVAGNIGSNERMEFTVIGDTVNVSSRLEGLTKEYGVKIIISENTYELVKHIKDFRFRELDFVNVKGRNKAIRIYEVIV